MVALAILADIEPVRPTRRKKHNLAINLVKMSVSAWRTVFSGRQDAGLYGKRGTRRYIFRQPLSITMSADQVITKARARIIWG
jgi:hypothetical protein